MALDKIGSNGQTNATWRGVIDAGIDLLNSDVLQAVTSITVTQLTDEASTQCQIAGHTSATFDSSNSGSSTAAGIIQAAINSLPKNMGGHYIAIRFGTETGQTVTISEQIDIFNFTGATFFIESAKSSDNSDGSSTKANKIQSDGTSIDRIFNIDKCSEVNLRGLELRQTTGTGSGFVVVVSTSWVDINYSVLTANYSTHQQSMRGVLSQRGANTWFRDSWVNNVKEGIRVINGATATQLNAGWVGTQPIIGMEAQAGIGILGTTTTIIEGSTSNFVAGIGGLITAEGGIILDENILLADKTIDIAAGSTRAEVQAIINEQPQDLNGYNLIFRFASGTTSSPEVYDFGAEDLQFKGFHGGVLTIRGVADESSTPTGTAYKTKLRSTKASWEGLLNIDDCRRVNVIGLQLDMYGTGTGQVGVRTQDSSVGVYDCRFTYSGTGTPNFTDLYVVGFDPLHSNGEINGCQFDKVSICVLGERSSHYFADNNVSFGTTPLRAYQATRGGIICPDGTVPNANTIYVSAEGGLITNKNGLILDETVLTVNKTVNFAAPDSSQSDKDAADVVFTGSNLTDLQDVINDQPKNLNGYDITFQFADGTYDFGTAQLQLKEFEGGTVNVWGNTGNSDIENLDVKIQTEITGGNGAFLVEKCSRIGFKNIAFEQNGSNTDTNLLVIRYSSDAVIRGCSFNSLNGTTTNDGISVLQADAKIFSCKFKNLNINILAQEAARVFSSFTSDFSSGSPSNINLRAGSGAVITQTATQASGTNSKVANEGGVIFDKDGALV